jgi:hypothetical protein
MARAPSQGRPTYSLHLSPSVGRWAVRDVIYLREQSVTSIRRPDFTVKHCAYNHSVATLLNHAMLEQFPTSTM